MKKIAFLPLLFMLSFGIIAQPPKGLAKPGMTFGKKTSAASALSINELAMVEGKATNVKIKGKVVEVCTEMGCWLKMETASGAIMIKMKGHSFFVPLDLNGKNVVVEGVASTTITPISELKHYAEDAHKSKDEIAKITEPKKETVVEASGILVL